MRTLAPRFLRLPARLLALAAVALLTLPPALANPASVVPRPAEGTSSGFSPAPGGGSILDDVLDTPGMTPINYCPAPSGDPCDPSGPASIGTGSGANLGVGNPVHLASGHKYRRETDLPALPGVLGLEIVRHYNSTLADPDRPLGILGRGWRLSYETELAVFERVIQVLQADGSRVFFTRSGATTLVAHEPAFGQLRLLGGAARPEGFEWRWPDGRRLDFDARGRLLQIVAPDGHFVTLVRAPDGSLLRVTDPQGRSLAFEYAARDSNGFRGVVAIDSPVGRFAFAHQNDRDAPGLSNLVAVTDPEGTVRRYHYGADETEFAPHLPHHLTGISVDTEAGPVRIATYDYDARGRATLSVRGAPLRTDDTGQPVPGTGIEQVSVDYPETGLTVVTNSLGERTTYRHAVINSGFRLIEAIGPGCASCGPTNRRYAYDALGRMVEEIALGADGAPVSATLFEYDTRGRVIARKVRPYVDGTPGESQLLARYEYAADTPHPTLIARPSVVPGAEHQRRITYNAHGQPLEVTESGFSPLDAAGEVASSPETATPITRTTTYTYTTINGRSLLTAIDGPLPNGPASDPSDSDITRFSWDARGIRIVRVTQPGERTSDIAYEAATGLVARVENREGVYTEFEYNARLQAVRIQRHGPGWEQAQTIERRFDTLGHLVETRSSDDPTRNTRLSFDAHGRLEWVANALGILEILEHDRESRLIGHRRLSASFEQGRFWHYDATGRLEATGDNRGSYVRASYDDQGRQAALRDASGIYNGLVLPSNGTSMQSDDTLGVVRLFDDFGHLVWRASPDNGVQHRGFDTAGRLVAMRDAGGHHARYEYDVRGRIQRQTVTDALDGGETVTIWRYEGDRLVELDHPTQHERYTYDARGLRVRRTVTIPTETGELTTVTRYKHDADGRLIATTLPDGSTLRYHRNGQAQVVSVTRSSIQTPVLRRFAREQVIASDFERDLVGLRRFTTGNGIETRFERSREGALARTVHRRLPQPPRRVVAGVAPSVALGQTLERVIGITAAHASPVGSGSNGSPAGASPTPTMLPGALGLPVEPGALLDRRYLWDTRGNLLLTRQPSTAPRADASTDTHAYDAHGQLVASVRWAQSGDGTAREEAVWRYAYSANQHRMLAQQGVQTQSDLSALTTRSQFEPGTHRRIGTDDTPTRYNANGQPLELDGRTYAWDALGRLVAVQEAANTLAHYGYDHRGLRNSKTIDADTHYTLHDEARQPLAELDANGRILRQYVWVADLPLAVIDTPEGIAPAAADPSTLGRIAGDLRRIVQSWFDSGDTLVWLHANHLNAPELATAVNGDIVWQAHYSPFGAATVQHQGFELDLRLPGQRFDAETGLHYNRQRYYDPEHGQYLTPDPLGTPDGPNPYAYVAFSPLTYIDPDGLILFAFDGTDNSDDPGWLAERGSTLSNVVFFRNAYDDGPARYVTGVGTDHAGRDTYGDIISRTYKRGLIPDRGGNYSGPDRIQRMLLYLHDEADGMDDDEVMQIDIVGFSRGAAQTRHFANLLTAATSDGVYRYQVHDDRGQLQYDRDGNPVTACQRVNFRFMGLFDTVLSTNRSGTSYHLGIPAAFQHVAQAVALNEYRSAPAGLDAFWTAPTNFRFWDDTRIHLVNDNHYGGFQLESIGASSSAIGRVRIERGFIGAHADIGGGYGDNDGLATVALHWMVAQAQIAGVPMKDINEVRPIDMNNPVIHDPSNVIRFGDPRTAPQEFEIDGLIWGTNTRQLEDRTVVGGLGGGTQRTQTFGPAEPGGNRSMVNADTHEFITYTPRRPGNVADLTAPTNDLPGLQGVPHNESPSNATGTVDMPAYMSWLRTHGYVFAGD